ncbi:MAG: DUF692 family multinuclear iron-containing protein [Candidatus Binatia bacterium]
MEAVRFGVGFRPRYFGELVDARARVDWLEVVSENFMGIGGRTRQMLLRLRADYPLLLHGVSLSIAGCDPLDPTHLARLAELAGAAEPLAVSDHLSWTSWRGRESHDLLPVAYTAEVLEHVAGRVQRVQEALRRRLVIENPTTYVAFGADEMDEADFLAELCRRTGCAVLLDINNLYVNALNLGRDPERYFTELPPDAVAYFHVAGHCVLPDVRIDTHDAPVPDPVWTLYERACARFPRAGTILERDDNFPPFGELLAELDCARAVHARAADRGVRPAPGAGNATEVKRESTTVGWPALQERFFAGVISADAGSCPALRADGPVSGPRGLRVYRDAFVERLCRGLRANYPALATVIGERECDALIAAYIAAHPPRTYAFSAVGNHLPEFILEHRFGAEFGVPVEVLFELAALERAELEVHDADDDGEALPPAALTAVAEEAWATARVRCTRALRLLHCEHDVLAVIEAVAAGAAPQRPAAGPRDYLICRPHADVLRRTLRPEEAAGVRLLIEGAAVADVAASLGDEPCAALLAQLAGLGVLRAIEA